MGERENLVGGAGVEPATSPLFAFGALFRAELSAFSRPLQIRTGTLASSPVLRKESIFLLPHNIGAEIASAN
jgi:hypothetical protein